MRFLNCMRMQSGGAGPGVRPGMATVAKGNPA